MADKFARTKSDWEYWLRCGEPGNIVANWRGDDPCWVGDGFNGKYAYPQTMKHYTKPSGGNNGLRLNKRWWDWIRALNLDPRWGQPDGSGWEAGRINNGGWINWASNKQFLGGQPVPDIIPPDKRYPIVEGITSGTINYVKVLETRNNAARIENINFFAALPDMEEINPIKTPWLFCKFSSIWFNEETQQRVVGLAPQGELFWFPLLAKEESWIPFRKLHMDVDLPGEDDDTMPDTELTRAWGADISKWNEPYNDDGFDEGLPPLEFVIQKAADGNFDLTDPAYNGNHDKWQAQYDSVMHLPLGGYQWFHTEVDWLEQAKTGVRIANSGLYDWWAIDYEAYMNEINEDTANDMKNYVEYFKANSNVKIVIYTNGWINTLLNAWFPEWMPQQELWFAGGLYYNTTPPLNDDIIPNLPNGFRFWQISANNQLADEWDFGTGENNDIDINIHDGGIDSLLLWAGMVGSPDPNPDPLPEPDCREEVDAVIDSIQAHAESLRIP